MAGDFARGRKGISRDVREHLLSCKITGEGQPKGRVESDGSLPEGIENRATWLLAGNRLELEKRGVGLLLERCVEGSDGHNEA